MKQLILDGHMFQIKRSQMPYREYVKCGYKDKACDSDCAFCSIENDSVYCQNHLIGEIVPKE